MRGQKVDWEGAEQRTASMPRGLAAAFIVFAFIVFLWCSSKAFFLQQQLYAAAATQTTKEQYCGDERRLIATCKGALARRAGA